MRHKKEPHILVIRITIAVLLIMQSINMYQERQAHQEIWNSLVEIRRDLILSVENQNLHLQTVQEFLDRLLEPHKQPSGFGKRGDIR